jgi:hypothetical protein
MASAERRFCGGRRVRRPPLAEGEVMGGFDLRAAVKHLCKILIDIRCT